MSENKSVATRDTALSGDVTFHQMERAAQAMAASGFFGVKSKDEAMALMLVAQADGLHFASAVRDYHVIQGRPALKSDAMLRRFLDAGGKVEYLTLTDQEVKAKFTHPASGTVTISWDDARVAQAGLKGGNHQKYPRQMKRARVISEGVRTLYPGAVGGMYTPEEIEDVIAEETQRTQVDAEASAQAEIPLGRAEGEQGTGLTDSEIEDHTTALKDAAGADDLRRAFGAAWKHAGEAKDEASKKYFQTVYNEQKVALGL